MVEDGVSEVADREASGYAPALQARIVQCKIELPVFRMDQAMACEVDDERVLRLLACGCHRFKDFVGAGPRAQ
ncbi:hypothetical protein AMK26_23670 [Streptomyces sp. CB03234]|nr:hypothetical protein AMK26_23670 [Streptomyces sp. CB03234]